MYMRAVAWYIEISTVVAIKTSLVTMNGLTCYHGGILVRVLEIRERRIGERCCLRLRLTAKGWRQNAQPPSWALAAPVKGKDCGSSS